jgi:hypothetical protein
LALIASLPPHHGESPSLMSSATESPFASFHEPFFNSIDPSGTLRIERPTVSESAKLGW